MRKNPDRRLATPEHPAPQAPTGSDAQRMRTHLAAFLERAAGGTLPVPPHGAGDTLARGDGHFHLAPELFLQVAGTTEFRFPHARLRLAPGEALVLPPKLLHDEHIGTRRGETFCNIVVYAEGTSMSCHLAHEARPGRPGILHLEARRHAQAARIHDWLLDASRAGAPGAAGAGWGDVQGRALIAAALAGVLRALAEADPESPAEPPLVARVRVLVQNHLGDHALSVRQLAEQCGCTADYLSHVFARRTGEHLVAYINRQRIERAAHLLRDEALAGKEVAWACGFATQGYFIRTFRAHHGITPMAWRAAQRGAAA